MSSTKLSDLSSDSESLQQYDNIKSETESESETDNESISESESESETDSETNSETDSESDSESDSEYIINKKNLLSKFDSNNNLINDSSKEFNNCFNNDLIKCFNKKSNKDSNKDFNKDSTKYSNKDFNKNFNKDSNKDFNKDSTKDSNKDSNKYFDTDEDSDSNSNSDDEYVTCKKKKFNKIKEENLSLKLLIKNINEQNKQIIEQNKQIIQQNKYLKDMYHNLHSEMKYIKNNIIISHQVKKNNRKYLIEEVYDIDDEFIKNVINFRDHRTIISILKKYYSYNNTLLYPFKNNKKSGFKYYKNDKWKNDPYGHYIIDIIFKNVKVLLFKVNTCDNFNNLNQFIENQNFICKLSDNKYKREFINIHLKNELISNNKKN